jgi:7-carboxy-7-deazaguanine synthase
MINNTKYEIADIFYSIQGEGYFTGTPAIFLRFCGCNLSCDFCDEPLHKEKGRVLTSEQIWDLIKDYKALHLVLTGGEPYLVEGLSDLLVYLKTKRKFFIQIETNGTINIKIPEIDWITVSPKQDNFITGNELKLPFYKDMKLKGLKNKYNGFNHYFIQPINPANELDLKLNEEALIEIKNNPEWRLSIQIHKVLKIK